jgi:hypothetical protein
VWSHGETAANGDDAVRQRDHGLDGGEVVAVEEQDAVLGGGGQLGGPPRG